MRAPVWRASCPPPTHAELWWLRDVPWDALARARGVTEGMLVRYCTALGWVKDKHGRLEVAPCGQCGKREMRRHLSDRRGWCRECEGLESLSDYERELRRVRAKREAMGQVAWDAKYRRTGGPGWRPDYDDDALAA